MTSVASTIGHRVVHRKGMSEQDVKPEDILCDYCGESAWAAGEPCVEGHRGSIVCGSCLTRAFEAVVGDGGCGSVDAACRMCVEVRDDPVWSSDFDPDAHICLRCIKQSATVLEKSGHWDWVRPGIDKNSPGL